MYCQNCGKQNQDEAKFCFDCGNSLTVNYLPSTPAQAVLQQAQINTSVVLYAGFWKRLAALLIDMLVVLLSCIPLMFLIIPLLLPLIIITGNNHQKMLELTNSIASIASYFMVLLYFSIMESSIKQGTLGKMALSIKVVDDDGNRISFWRSVGRNFAKLISGSGLLFVGYLIAAFTAKKQAVHDMMADCLVVNKNISSVQIQQDGPVKKMSTSLIIGLILLSLLIPISGIVAAIVVPAYQDYKVRVQQRKKNEIENGKQPSTIQSQSAVQTQSPQHGKPPKPFDDIQQKANTGDAEAQLVLGRMYNNGKDVTLDYAQSAYWYRKAADQENPKAQFSLGLQYYNGQGVPQDYAQAIYWFRKAADQGDVASQRMVGVIYYKGQGVPQDYAQAIYWHRKAADQGDIFSQLVLGWIYDTGNGALQDYAQSAYWYRKAADQGNPKAQFSLGLQYYNGQGVPQDYAQAIYWHRKAADQGEVHSQLFLGLTYFLGQGVPQDYAQAAYWYLKAANNGDAEAQYMIGTIYRKGQGISKDYSQAAYWYLKAAEQRHAKAQLELSLLYGSGLGITQDDMTALAWLYISYFCSEGTPFREEISQILSEINTKYTTQQIAEAQQRAKAWFVANPKKN